MLDFEAAVSGLSCAAWMYRHTLLHPIQMGEKMVCQAGSDCCDPCCDRRVCRISGRYDTERMVGFFFWLDRMGEKMESIHAFLKGSKIEVEMNCFYRIVRCLIWCSLSIFVTIIMGLGMKNYVRNCTEKGKRGGEL